MRNIRVQLLDAVEDRDRLVEAYNWRETAPRWFRECLDVWKESLEEYLNSAADELHYGIWGGEEMLATVRLIPCEPAGTYNIHLNAKKGIDFEALFVGACTLRDFVFKQGKVHVYGYLPSINRGISQLYECLGFVDSGIRVFKGVVHGKVIEWKHYVIAN